MRALHQKHDANKEKNSRKQGRDRPAWRG